MPSAGRCRVTTSIAAGWSKRTQRKQARLWIAALVDPRGGNDIYTARIDTARIAGPEIVAAFTRKTRTGEITPAEAARITAAFRYDWRHDHYILIEVIAALTDRAMDLAERHGLRGYDAVHLAAAIEIRAVQRTLSEPEVIFVSADSEQAQAAATEGLIVEDPLAHP